MPDIFKKRMEIENEIPIWRNGIYEADYLIIHPAELAAMNLLEIPMHREIQE